MNGFLRRAACVGFVIATGTAATGAAAVAAGFLLSWAGLGPGVVPFGLWFGAAWAILAWMGITAAAGIGEAVGRSLGLHPGTRAEPAGLPRSLAAFGAGVVAGYGFFAAGVLLQPWSPAIASCIMAACGTVGLLTARGVLRGGLYAEIPASPAPGDAQRPVLGDGPGS